MSQQEHEQLQEGRSSVKILVAAKGELRWEVKVRVGDTADEVNAARQLAVATHQALERDLLEPAVGRGS